MIIVCARRQHATFGDWCLSSSHRNDSNWYTPVWCCSPVWCTPKHLEFSLEAFSDHRKWKWQTTVWASTCDVTEARPMHQGDARNLFQPASVTARTIPGLHRIHPRNVRNRLCEHHIRPRRPCVRTLLLPRHRAERLPWTRAHLRWRLKEWEAVLFSDGSRFSLDHSDGRIMVNRRVGERYQDAYIRQRHAFGSGSVMVWGGISAHGRTPRSLLMAIWMHTATWRRLLDRTCCPSSVVREGTWQQDNARPHVVRLIMNFLRHENVLVIAWPSMSPDLSPIEHVWNEMDRRLRPRPNQPVTLQRLGKALQEVWQEIQQAWFSLKISDVFF